MLRIDEIRERISVDVASNFRISTVYDVYDLFSLLFGKGEEGANHPKISKNEFEISVFCGDLVVVIDGLDELYSVFQDRFDKDSFIDSIQSLNDQLGESSVVLTSRGNIFADNVKSLGDVQVCYLRGFDREECSEYFEKRFYHQDKGELIKRKCEDNVEGLIKATKVERISPFVVDLISNINSEQLDGIEDDNYSLKGKSYPSNSDFKDKVVFHVLRREKKRQEIHITTKELIELFCEMATEHGPTISLVKLREICEIYFEKQVDSVFEYLKISPLLQVRGDVMSFRYHFLHEYFMTLYLIDGIINQAHSASFIDASAKYADGMSASYADVLKYFRNHKDTAICCKIANRLKVIRKSDKAAQTERAISFIVHLMIDIRGSGISRKDLSEEVFTCFADSSNGQTVSYLFVYGDCMPLDFSGRKFSHCGFYGYTSFMISNLDHAFFSYTTVDIETEERNGLHVTRDTFDSTCRIGRLSRFLGDGSSGDEDERASNEEMLRRFFLNFVESNMFIEKHVRGLLFPSETMNIKSRFFREAVRQHIIYISKNGDHCGVTRAGERVVHNYLTNNAMEIRIYKILQKL